MSSRRTFDCETPQNPAGWSGQSMELAEPVKPETPRTELADALEAWLGPLADELSSLTDGQDVSDEEFGKRLAACADGGKNGSEALQNYLEGQIYEGLAYGAGK